jgi:cell division septum initiation protein DivIVA
MIFPQARFGRRGLDEEHVRAFCARVEDEIVFLLNERATLFQHAEQLRRQFVAESRGEPGYSPEAAQLQAVQILSSAQQTADRLVAEAQRYCRDLADGAKQRRDQLIADARRNALQILEQADAEARAAAQAVVSPAAAEPEQRGPHGGDPQEEVAYLRIFSEVYRTHLRAYLQALLQNVDEWGRAERESVKAMDIGD